MNYGETIAMIIIPWRNRNSYFHVVELSHIIKRFK